MHCSICSVNAQLVPTHSPLSTSAQIPPQLLHFSSGTSYPLCSCSFLLPLGSSPLHLLWLSMWHMFTHQGMSWVSIAVLPCSHFTYLLPLLLCPPHSWSLSDPPPCGTCLPCLEFPWLLPSHATLLCHTPFTICLMSDSLSPFYPHYLSPVCCHILCISYPFLSAS